MATFQKTDHRPGRILYEVAGLEWLADTPPEAAPVVPVLDYGKDWLEEPELDRAMPTQRPAEDFGRALAYTHAAGASHFGAPPPHNAGQGWMGNVRLPLPETPAEAPSSWGEFYATMRIGPYLDAPAFSSRQRAKLDRLCEYLSTGALDHDQPQLVKESGSPVARIHGDLWSGNIVWTPEGATLIDPAAQGNHAEEDLAGLAVFGTPYLDIIWDAYNEVSPLADGWRERMSLHQLHMLMLHCHLFGGSYVPTTMRIVDKWLPR